MANLVIDIGNTALKAAWADGVTLGKTFRYQGEKMYEFILSLTQKEKPEVMVISTVRDIPPHAEEKFRKECEKLVILDSKHQEVLKNKELPLFFTPDRAASLIAVRYLFKGRSCTVFDLGTTLTVDFIDSEGRYLGGNISPGCRTRFKSLNRYSKSLPLVDTPADCPEMGTDLQSSIEAGVISGIIFEIGGSLEKFPGNIAVFTGGDANYFAKRMKNSIFVVCNLVLMGLALIAEEEYVEKD